MDLISQLPEPILHDILNCLPPKDAARTCVLSKAWNLIQYRTPFLRFYKLDFPSPNSTLSSAEKYLDRRDDDLAILSFAFHCSCDHNYKDNHRLASLLKRVMNHGGTQKFDLMTQKYILPHFVLQSDRLTTLRLCNCKIDDASAYNFCLPKLTRLVLSSVNVDNHFVERLTHGCPLLQCLEIRFCRLLTSLRVTRLERLQTVTVIHCKHLSMVEIMSRNLHSFRGDKQCVLILSPLKELTLECATIKPCWLQSQLSFCEELTLDMICFVDGDIHISSQKLTRLKIKKSTMNKVPQIDCPNLQSLVYVGNSLPFCSVCEFKSLCQLKIEFGRRYTPSIPLWHDQLTDLFQKFGSIKEFIKQVVIYTRCQDIIIFDGFTEFMIPNLKFGMDLRIQSEVVVVTSSISNNWQLNKMVKLVCKSNQTRVYVASTDCSNNNFSHVLFDKLSRIINAEANCDKPGYRYWRHYLSSVSKDSTTNIVPTALRSQHFDQCQITTIQLCQRPWYRLTYDF